MNWVGVGVHFIAKWPDMAYSRFRINVVVRISLVLLLGYLSIYVILFTHFWLVGFWTTLAGTILVYNLIRYVERSDREMANFLLAIKQGDFSNTYSGRGTSQRNAELSHAFSEILKVFQTLSTERETNHLFLQTVVEHISIALVTFDENGDIISFNKSAKRLFNKPYLKNLQSLESQDPQLYEKLKNVRPDQGELIKILLKGELQNLSLRATTFVLKDHQYKIVSLQDIKSELEEKEVESWQKLIRVLTHEIMNSAIPISTLSSVISEMLEDEKGQPLSFSQLDDDVGQDVLGGLKTIESRSKGLVRFVDAYKSLTKIAPPKFEDIDLKDFVDGVKTLMASEVRDKRVKWSIDVENGLTIKGDKELLEQVLINLVKNALEAVEGVKAPMITVKSVTDQHGKITLSVSDNGPGIDQENLDNIFVPFFSTKKNGSGIGLSLSRQIMRLHKGSIRVNSSVGGTKFNLTF